MEYGVQLYGVRDLYKRNPNLFFQSLKMTGIAHIEPCIAMDSLKGVGNDLWSLGALQNSVEHMSQLGIRVESVHVFSLDMKEDFNAIIHMAAQTSIRQVVVKAPQTLTKESLLESAYVYMELADALAVYSVKLAIHNDLEDIRTRIGEQSAYEWLIDACQGKVQMQVDVGWLMVGGEDPEAFLWKHRNQITSIHYRDFLDVHNPATEVSIGKGKVDILACFQFARAMGICQILDQDQYVKDKMQEIGEAVSYLDSFTQRRDHAISFLNILDVETGEVKVLHTFDRVIEAPNWLKHENAILYNSEGHIYRYDCDKDEEQLIETGICDNCNNDHVVSPDETYIAVSHGSKDSVTFESRVYRIPIGGGEAELITPESPSFLHGWSPDGKELSYCGFRMHDTRLEIDIYAIFAEGGEEKRLTFGGFNDGPEYSPDGKHIWYNSTKTGLMQIWRMDRDGRNAVLMTDNERNNWFAHVSPDSKHVVYLSYQKGELLPHEHLPNMFVEFWMMDYDGRNKKKLLPLFGGQGSINVNSWAKDSRHLAFVSYELLHK